MFLWQSQLLETADSSSTQCPQVTRAGQCPGKDSNGILYGHQSKLQFEWQPRPATNRCKACNKRLQKPHWVLFPPYSQSTCAPKNAGPHLSPRHRCCNKLHHLDFSLFIMTYIGCANWLLVPVQNPLLLCPISFCAGITQLPSRVGFSLHQKNAWKSFSSTPEEG